MEHKLTHPQLVEFLGHQIELARDKSIAVFVIELRRADRLDALTGKISSQAVLRHADQRLNSSLRDTDRFAHIDGERILLVLPKIANKDHSVLAAIKIISELKKPVVAGNHSITLRPFIGIANFPELSRESHQLLIAADIALRMATTEEHGYYVCQPGDMDEIKSYKGLEIELKKAIHLNELQVNFQPKIDMQTGQCLSAEALVRWSTSSGQDITPQLLIGIAEDSGLINPLTLWILNTSIRHAASFHKAGAKIGISVNLPPKMLEDDELPQIVQQALDVWGMPASALTLEITESSVMKNIESSISMLSKLRELGIRLSLDDFGTGYSSLAYLKRLPVQELKIDILFVRNIHNSVGDKQLVRSIIDLAHNFDLITVAEGVEDQHTFELLRDLGCDEAQGFLFSRALSAAEFIGWHRLYCEKLAEVINP
jgi:EAL domain-containing protein (putative c-di-GMP-specific phosphodiesterase class I)/GGDEF domain-containing protein